MATLSDKLVEGVKQTDTPKAAIETPSMWSIRDISGSKDGVIKHINEQPIPDHWKLALVAEVARLCQGDFNFIYVDAHYFTDSSSGNSSLCVTLTPDKKLL